MNSVLVLGPYEYWVGRYSLSVCPGETSHNSGSGYLVTRRIWALWRTSKIMYWLSQVLEQHEVYYFGLPSSTHTLHPSRSSMLPEVSNKEPWAPHRLPWKACSEHTHIHITYMKEEGRLPLLRRSTAPHQCAHWRGPGFSALFQWTEQVPKSPEEWMASDFRVEKTGEQMHQSSPQSSILRFHTLIYQRSSLVSFPRLQNVLLEFRTLAKETMAECHFKKGTREKGSS